MIKESVTMKRKKKKGREGQENFIIFFKPCKMSLKSVKKRRNEVSTTVTFLSIVDKQIIYLGLQFSE